MKSFLYYAVIAAFAVMVSGSLVFSQTLEPIGGPYNPDSATVVLLHFDGDFTNSAAAVGKTAPLAVPHSTNPAKIYFLPNSGVTGLGQCVRIDNSSINDSSYITMEDTASLDMTGSWTIEAWVNIFTFGANSNDYRWVPRVVMKPGDDVFWHPNYWLEMWGDNRLFHAGYYTPSDAFISVTSPNNMFVPGEWVHLTFIRDTARAFIAVMIHDANKNLRGFLTSGFNKATDIPKINSQKLYMGWAGTPTDPSTDSYLDGFIDEVRISNVVRNFAGPPVIQNVTVLANQPSTLTSYPVKVTVFPLNTGGTMSSVVLKYRTDTTGTFSTIAMTPTGNPNEYMASIPQQPFKTRVQYYVKCTDNNGQVSLSPIDAESSTAPVYYSFLIFQPNVKTLDVTFEEGPTNPPIDHSTNQAKIITHKILEYSTDVPMGGGKYSLLLQAHQGVIVDSNWVEAESPFLAAEEFTLDTWIKLDSADLPYVRIIFNPTKADDWNNANFGLELRPNANGQVALTSRYWHSAGAVVLQDTVAATQHVGKWRHIIIERDKSTGVFAMAIRDENDALLYKKSTVNPATPLMAAAPLRIGRAHFIPTDNWYIPPFRGRIDNVKVYNYPAVGITDVRSETPKTIPWQFTLGQNYPNPFNPSTEIRFTIPKFEHVSLVVYDVLGRRVKTLIDEQMHAGEHRATWNGTNDANVAVASGVYFYKLKAGDATKTLKMLLVR